ncbi:hypothetical protein [Gordonia sp. UCD-TK1]|uniref:hypothetical protein n=1 Tax=Gordonia sp. UCD-TK1 TaxID=1857893 RepID=UPI00080E01C4|nr:hypothetical protein [Gordonia sp. UCD-TK1]OCH81773.1 hypothetical protein A9310_04070 [Gordonia sp. UCD-TK1]
MTTAEGVMSSATPLAFHNPGRPLPALEGKVSGVVGWQTDDKGKSIASVQCSTCHQVAAGPTIFAVQWALFKKDKGEPGIHPYRRCQDCRDARRHPEAAS